MSVVSEFSADVESKLIKIKISINNDIGIYNITNRSLTEMLKEENLIGQKAILDFCYDFAYLARHPYIYPLAERDVSVLEYSINLLWVNLNPQDRVQNIAQNIFRNGLDSSENSEWIKDLNQLRQLENSEASLSSEELDKWHKIKNSFTYRLSKWADEHPGAQINLWYDSALVTQQAQQKTLGMLKDLSQTRRVDLRLRDVRRLPRMQNEEMQKFLHPGTNLYFRVDFLKVLIIDHMIGSADEKAKYCVFSDIDVEPMSAKAMFDQRTLNYLATNGYVLGRYYGVDFENNFHIFNREKDELQKFYYEDIIGKIMKVANTHRQGSNFPVRCIFHAESVFRQYGDFVSAMGEGEFLGGSRLLYPRKVIKCPPSQFYRGGDFRPSDFQSESFRFIGASNIPYTLGGRNVGRRESQMEMFSKWSAEPLT